MTTRTASLALVPNRKSLDKLQVTEDALDRTFLGQVLPSGVTHLLETHCFLADPIGHADCQNFWNTIPDTEQPYEFFCLGRPFECVNCGAKIDALVTSDGQRMRRGHCPACNEAIEWLGLEQAHWWEMLAHVSGKIIDTYDNRANEIVSGLIFRLADFMIRGGIEASADGANGYENTKDRVYYSLLDLFPNRHAWCSYAANWAVYGRIGAEALGLTLPLSTTAKCEFMPNIVRAAKRSLAGETVPDMSDILDGDGDQRAKARAMKRRLEEPADNGGITYDWQPEAPPTRIPTVQFCDENEGELPYLLLRITPNDLLRLSEVLEVTPLTVGADITQWLAETMGACAQ